MSGASTPIAGTGTGTGADDARRTGAASTAHVGAAAGVGGGADRSAAPPPDRIALKRQAQRDKAAARELLEPVDGAVTAASALIALAGVAAVAPFVLVAELCRRALQGSVDDVEVLVIAAFVVLVGRGVLQLIAFAWTHTLDGRLQLDLRRRLATKLSRIPLGWFSDRRATEVRRLLADDVGALHYLVAHARLEFVQALVVPLVTIGYLLIVDWRLTLALFVPLVAYAVALGRMTGPAHDARLRVFNQRQQVADDVAQEYIDGIAEVRAFGQTGRSSAAFEEAVDAYAAALDAWKSPITRIQAASQVLLRPVFLLLVVTTAAVGLASVDRLDPADLVPFLLVGVSVGSSLLGLAFGSEAIRQATAAGGRIVGVLGTDELATRAVDEASFGGARPDPQAARGAVRFIDVAFGHDDTLVLDGIDAELAPGTVTALVGTSGSGKTTLARLLARFDDVDRGSITVGGRDVRTLEPTELYRRVAFVFQDVHLIRGSVADNLRLARPDATAAELEFAARTARIHDHVSALPRGYESEIGVDASFSGGEAQRLAIARVLLADAPVLVLDEATAFADPHSEAAVQDALAALLRDRTTLVIAHRLHTITAVDQILVLSEGRIVERGDHRSLVAADGHYAELWRADERALVRLGSPTSEPEVQQ
ncbi:MAG: ABC transporter ATP-binding protein [Actinomycetota bacterium]